MISMVLRLSHIELKTSGISKETIYFSKKKFELKFFVHIILSNRVKVTNVGGLYVGTTFILMKALCGRLLNVIENIHDNPLRS